LRTSVIFILYRAALLAAFPFLLLYLLWRVARDRRYSDHILERFGFWRLPLRTPAGGVWLHAVSVGEVLSCVGLIRRIREDVPHTPIYLSCGTLAGREVAERKIREIADGVFYAPLDWVFAVRRALRATRPSVLVVLETEIWPNLYREAKRAGAAVVIVNGRMSDKTAAGYERHRWFFSAALEQTDQILTQSTEDERRYLAAGAPKDRVRVGGNIKYDFHVSLASPPEEILPFLTRPLWVAASTTGPMHAGDVDEDDVVISAYRELLAETPELRLLIAPRRPERFDVVAQKLAAAGISFARRSQLTGQEDARVLLLDSVGELSSVFPYADLVFMGGTLAHRGGHNILEPALCAKPVIAGPHLENFAAIRDRFVAARGYVAIERPEELTDAVRMLLTDGGHRESLGARAKALAEAERGATARAVRMVAAYRWMFVPRAVRWGWTVPILRALSAVWQAGGILKRAVAHPRQLPKPVISIGGLAMGGVGKTPTAGFLADCFRAKGYEVAILTRGYHRRSSEKLYLERGSDVPASATGDEAQLLLRSAHVGIGSDRWKVGMEMSERFRPDLFLLDDGFQHARLHRNVDVVLLDALDPLAGDAVFPQGRLRESLAALQRADVLVITRAGNRRFDGLIARLPKKPVFLADVEVSGWLPERPPLNAVFAFCGLANPQAFFETLEDTGARIVSTVSFHDHHRYSLSEIQRLSESAIAAGARVLVTTEKDWVNLPSGFEDAAHPLRIHTLAIRTRIRNESEFFATLESLAGLNARMNDGRARRRI
jgi:tetraacyldisaccharide 4'-kinase